ncbi:hypothetical protein N7466_010241 [Penicillium verhagenii]|uniref:uncharacterized protein n=1 Tax=Penicillium verhagenii TaxID=1562060 RepID=UPI0025451807|nr:uncharacterized protein N7466_010241 [Penicillium verhagenii]KAJ5919298.1 hypothetical protein N7466_010241 [Penicillium verhagenii]
MPQYPVQEKKNQSKPRNILRGILQACLHSPGQCDGDAPCRACVARGHECQRTGTDMRGKWRNTNARSGSTDDFVSRSSNAGNCFGTIGDLQDSHRDGTRTNQTEAQRDVTDPAERQASIPETRSTSTQVPTFSGETSLTHNLTVVESRLKQMGVQYARLRSASPSRRFRSCLTPSPDHSPEQHKETTSTFVNQVLHARGLVPRQEQWDELLHNFCDEVHVLVPFLHLPSLWRLYEGMWTNLIHGQSRNHDQNLNGVIRVQTAHVLMCLANGRCGEYSRTEGEEGRYSAGWSFYNAARDIFGDLLNGFIQCTDQILVLQTVLLMVVYLFRIDAHGPAEKVLALSISHAHHLGLHRNRAVEKMSPFESEMSRRLWWFLYLMDRRLAIETGRPFLIQDINVDVGLPRNVGDDWLTRSQSAPHESNLDQETNEAGMTYVPYLIAMASYSRVIGKVWESLYGAATSDSTATPLLNEYLEHLTTQSQKDIDPEFSYDPRSPGNIDINGLPWWQIKQIFIMRIRWSSLYLLIRKPMLKRAWSPNQPLPEAIENEVICMRVAQSIFDDFNSMPEQHPKYTFPFLHYLTNATIIALALIIKQPSFKRNYGQLTLKAARSLWEHCRKTWVSGRMAQSVWRLNQMADATLKPADDRPQIGNPHHRRHDNLDQSGLNVTTDSQLSVTPAPLSVRFGEGISDTDRTPSARARSGISASHIQPIDRPCVQTSRPMTFNETAPTGYEPEQRGATQNVNKVQKPDKALNVEIYPHNQLPSMVGISATDSNNRESQIPSEMARVSYFSAEARPVSQDEPDVDLSFPGEIIDGGMEWLQTLFVDGLDTHLLPVWD